MSDISEETVEADDRTQVVVGAAPESVLDPAEIIQSALNVRKADTGERLLFQYVLHDGPVRERNYPSLYKLFETTAELGHHIWPLELKGLIQGRDILDLNCGANLHGAAFRALGARSYTGVDKGIEPTRKRLRSRMLKQSVGTPFSLSDAARLISGLAYFRNDGVSSREAYDLALVRASSHSVPDFGKTLAQIHRALRPGGGLWFNHQNFYAWSGHGGSPRQPGSYDPGNPEHVANVDWGHVTFDPPADHRFATEFNRVRLPELRRLVNRYFEIVHWRPTMEKASIWDRMTPEVRAKLVGYSDDELTTRSVICYARRRDIDA